MAPRSRDETDNGRARTASFLVVCLTVGFLFSSTPGAEAPPWPHVVCAGGPALEGRGWAWHEDEQRRRCYVGEIAAPADLVARAIDGRELAGVDRILAIVELHGESPGGLVRLFRIECPACRANHWERAKRALRVAPVIHQDAVALLRAARVPEALLCEPRKRRVGQPEKPPSVKRKRAPLKSLPVWLGDAGRTRLSQIAFARQYALEKGVSLAHAAPSTAPDPVVPARTATAPAAPAGADPVVPTLP